MDHGNNKQLALSKLILLYIIDKANKPISNLQIMKLILENKLMNYFSFQKFLKDLCDNNLLVIETLSGATLYSITNAGKQTLSFFMGRIPFGIKSTLDVSINKTRKDMKNEILISANYSLESENKFVVSCQVKEDEFSLIDIDICVGTKNDARTICNNWKNNSHLIYPEIIESLLKKRNPIEEKDTPLR